MELYDALKVFSEDSQQYKNLQKLADALNSAGQSVKYTVETVYFDYGQNWKYTTILAHRPNRNQHDSLTTWQAMTPAQQMIAVSGHDIDALKSTLLQKYADIGKSFK